MNQFGKKIGAVVVLGAIGCSAPAWAQQPLKFAGQNVSPWAVKEKNSAALSGIFVDLTNALAKDAGLSVQYQLMTFADLIPALTSGKIDVIATEMAITPARAGKSISATRFTIRQRRRSSSRRTIGQITEPWQTSKMFRWPSRKGAFNLRSCNRRVGSPK